MSENIKIPLTPKQQRMFEEYNNRIKKNSEVVTEECDHPFNSVVTIFQSIRSQSEGHKKALILLQLRDWFTNISEFDPSTGQVLHSSLYDMIRALIHKSESTDPDKELKEYIYRIVDHVNNSVYSILQKMRSKILREHMMLPIYSAREVDSTSIRWLSRQPGRTVREKLSGKPYLKAVRRSESLDTLENRLLKAFLSHFLETLTERQSTVCTQADDICEEFLLKSQVWLNSVEAEEIGYWRNLPPNNVLLQDKRYRKVWDSWLWLQSLDSLIKTDSIGINQRIPYALFGELISRIAQTWELRLIQQPVKLDYYNFTLQPLEDIKGVLIFEGKNVKDRIKDILFSIGVAENNLWVSVGVESISIDFSYPIFTIKGSISKKTIQQTERIESINKVADTVLSKFSALNLKTSNLSGFNNPLQPNSGTIADIFSIRPRYSKEPGKQNILPFRLLYQIWENNEGLIRYEIDCDTANAIALSEDIKSVSLRSLFLSNKQISEAEKSRISIHFASKLRTFFNSDKLNYIVPDWINDFELEQIRKGLNFYFRCSEPIPRSIAAVFSWQSSDGFKSSDILDGDIIIILDTAQSGLSLTPIKAVYNEELLKILPLTLGFAWERHPTIVVNSPKYFDSFVANLEKNGCIAPSELFNLFGFDGLVLEAGKFSIKGNDVWYHLPKTIRNLLLSDSENLIFSEDLIRNFTKLFSKRSKQHTFIIPIEKFILKPKNLTKSLWINSSCTTIAGCHNLNEWQKEVPEIPLWRDHLPELSIEITRDGRPEKLYLVKEATITPKLGKTVAIPVSDCFTLPAGQNNYSFQLQQGEGSNELQFVAFLNSPAFPLKYDTICNLQMTYTYGADDPYELTFISHDRQKAGFSSIKVEWRLVDDSLNNDDLPFPSFPSKLSWDELQKFPREDGQSFSDLLEWCSSKLNSLKGINTFNEVLEIQRLSSQRKKGNLYHDGLDKNMEYYCLVEADGENVFCHSNHFHESIDFTKLKKGETVYFKPMKSEKGTYGLNITFSESVTPELLESFKEHIYLKYEIQYKNIERAINIIRFPTYTIWNHGRSLTEPDVPDYFRKAILDGINNARTLLESDGIPQSLKDEIFFFLCCLQADTPDFVWRELINVPNSTELFQYYYRHIAYAIGSLKLNWQKELFAGVLQLIHKPLDIRSTAMIILSISLWRSDDLVFKLDENDLETILSLLYECIDYNYNTMTTKRDTSPKLLSYHLELLLALFRVRENGDQNTKRILSPRQQLIKKFVVLLDNISNYMITNDLRFKSRIGFQVHKPEIYKNTPDLLYALRMYLTGNSGANNIIINSISNE